MWEVATGSSIEGEQPHERDQGGSRSLPCAQTHPLTEAPRNSNRRVPNMVSLDTFPARTSSNKRAAAASSDETNSVIFAHIAFILCICMQRFGLLIGTGQIFFSLFG